MDVGYCYYINYIELDELAEERFLEPRFLLRFFEARFLEPRFLERFLEPRFFDERRLLRFLEAHEGMRSSFVPELPLELALIKLSDKK